MIHNENRITYFHFVLIKTNENDVSLSIAIKAPTDLVILAAFLECMGSFFIVSRVVVWLDVVELPAVLRSRTLVPHFCSGKKVYQLIDFDIFQTID